MQRPLEVHTAALELIDQIAHNVNIVRRDDVCAVCNLFDFALIRICNAAEEIHQTTRDILVGLLQIEYHRALVLQVIGNLCRLLKAVGFTRTTASLLVVLMLTTLLSRRLSWCCDTVLSAGALLYERSYEWDSYDEDILFIAGSSMRCCRGISSSYSSSLAALDPINKIFDRTHVSSSLYFKAKRSDKAVRQRSPCRCEPYLHRTQSPLQNHLSFPSTNNPYLHYRIFLSKCQQILDAFH